MRCKHNWKIVERSNALQQDEMGYPLRLCIVKCSKCDSLKQTWIDVPEDELNELKTGKSFLFKWNLV